MELIRKTKVKITKNGNKIRYAIFKCSFCLQEVERQISAGNKQKSCGCQQHSEEVNKRVSIALIGKKRSKESINKQRKAVTGKKRLPHTEETKQKIRESHLGKQHTEEHKSKVSKAKKGKKRSEEVKQSISRTKKGKYIGELSSNWQNGISFLPYSPEFNKELKRFILERDNYTCQCPDCEYKSTKLDIHHIDYDKKNSKLENLITLCAKCHSKTNGKNKRKYFTEFYQNIMKEIN